MKNLENLTPAETLHLKKTLSHIALLIAGADGNIDAEEIAWADKLTNIRGYSGEKWLQAFYDDVHTDFLTDFNTTLKALPTETAARQQALALEISSVNPILEKLDPATAYKMYHSFMTFSESIAKSSGGILGFGSISRAESKWVGLPMINAIAEPSHTPMVEEENDEA